MKSRKGVRVAIPIAPLSLLLPVRGGNETRIGKDIIEDVDKETGFKP